MGKRGLNGAKMKKERELTLSKKVVALEKHSEEIKLDVRFDSREG